MSVKIKVVAQTDLQNESFEVVFFGGSEKIIGNLLRRMFEASGCKVVERRPNDMTVLWEVNLPAGKIVNDDTLKMIDHAFDIVGAPV